MKKTWMWLTIIFTLLLATRLYFAYQTPFHTTDESYLHLRTIEQIQQLQDPFHDELGYGGRTLITNPIYGTILAIFAKITPHALKILPNLLAALLTIPAFLIARKLTNNTKTAALAAILANLVPAYYANTFNHISPLTLTIPLFFFTTYAWLKATEKKWTIPYIISLLVLTFINPLSILLVLAIGAHLLLRTLEQTKPTTTEYELGLFSIFFVLWAHFIMYKKLILFHGPSVIWQNIPTELLTTFYSDITIIGAIAQIGIFPLLDGTYALYKTAFKEPQKETQMLLSIAVISTLMLWLKLIDLKTGLILLGITLAIAFAHGFTLLINYFKETKLSKYIAILATITVISALATTTYPMYTSVQNQLQNTITQEEMTALKELQIGTKTIMAPVNYGHYITYAAKQKNVIDNYFYLQPRINEIQQDVTRTYRTNFETEAVELMDKYDATHLIVPPNMKDIQYPKNCFDRIHSTNIKIYKKNPKCKLRVVA